MELNQYIDHTLLKPEATKDQIIRLCEEAKAHRFKSVCVNPANIDLAKEILADSDVLVCTVVGFPLGANTVEVKVFETKDAITRGADEIDMVINIGKAKEHDYDYIEDEIRQVVQAAEGKTVKVIIETALLTDEEKVQVCLAAKRAGAHFVKTSTGFSTGGATVEDVKLMKDTVGDEVEVKASGGVRSREDAIKMIDAGATSIGTSSGVKIVQGS